MISSIDFKNLESLISNSKFLKVLDCNDLNGYKSLLYVNNEDNKEFILVFRRKPKEDLIITKDNIFQSEQTFKNDVFFKFNVLLTDHERYEIDIIYSTENISKYQKKMFVLVQETPKMYNDIIKPYVEKLGKVKFIENILFNGAEELLLARGDRFVVLKDYKYISANDHYYLGISFKGIRSLRDLSETDLPLLEELLGAKYEIEEKMKLEKNQLQAFVHYYPSYFHFHVHYVDLNLDNYSNKLNKAFCLFDIIQNIKLKSDYYQTATLNVSIDQSNPIYKLIQEGNKDIK